MSQKKSHKARSFFITLIVLATFGVILYFHGWTIYDTYRASSYTTSPAVSSVESAIGLTSRSNLTFRATHPAIESSESFNTHCNSTERTAAILGCYSLDHIYIYDVENTELTGAKEVTAAHELLHAEYTRLNFIERAKVNEMLKTQYEKVENDSVISAAMKYYSEKEPGAELDELHSILGTTVTNLDSDLEQYYAQYFTNRASIVSMNATYNAVFDKVNAEATALQTKITTEKTKIEQELESYKTDLAQLNADIESFNKRVSEGDFSTQSEFNVARTALQTRSSELATRRNELNAAIDSYNQDVANLNKLAVKAQELNQSINGVTAGANNV